MDIKYLQGGTIDGGTLPEIVITGFRPIRLRTYYPVISKYPFTGHSELYIPIDKQTFYNTPNLYINHKVIVNDKLTPYIQIDKDSHSKNYNLITNNCADATLTYLNKIFGTSEKTNFFTTPGDVKDFAEKKLNGRTFKRSGYYETLIPRNKNNYKILSKKAMDNFSSDLHTNKYTIRLLQGGIVQDNTRVWKPLIVLPFKLSAELKARIRQLLAEKNLARIYDKDKADYYRNLQRAYNSNFFGFGVFGNLTNYDSTTTLGLKAIEASANYTKDNIANLGATLLTTGVGTTLRGVLPLISRRRTIGQLRDLSKYKIGEGAEAIVINNSPTTVGKITTIPRGEMNLRNSIPNTVKSKFVGYTKDDTMRLPTYILRKVKTITEEAFPKYIKKLDKAMGKKGYLVVDDPNVLYRAYANGDLIVDDVSPDNIGLNWLRKPKMIDFTVSPASEWIH